MPSRRTRHSCIIEADNAEDETLALRLAGGVMWQDWPRARFGLGNGGIAPIHQGLKDWQVIGTEVIRLSDFAL